MRIVVPCHKLMKYGGLNLQNRLKQSCCYCSRSDELVKTGGFVKQREEQTREPSIIRSFAAISPNSV